MMYESSYESGRQPFQPDTKRGKWLNPNDFIYAGISLVFRVDILSMSWLLTMSSGVLTLIPVYLLSMVLYIVPFIVLQSFMGQFSSSGFISAFRLSPMFKGIGYVTLVMNICVLAYHSIFAMVPLLYMFASFQSTLPWGCDGFKKWAQNLTDEEETNLCNIHVYNESESTEGGDYFINHHIPSVLYFKSLFHDLTLFHDDDHVEFSMSWQLLLCALLVWSIIALIVYKYFKTETIGAMIRYSLWTVVSLMIFFVIRFSFLPGAHHVYSHAFKPSWHGLVGSLLAIPIYGLSGFGPGWGLFLTLSSHNKFKTNIIKSSWIIAFAQFGIIFGLDLLMNFTEGYFNDKTDGSYYSQLEHVWILYLSTGSAMAHMAWANLWSILFFFMLFLSGMILLIIQLHSILTTIYDEFAYLRERKHEVAMWIVAAMAVASLYFSSNHGIAHYSALAIDSYITQAVINFLLILIVLWIYGRIRFQRDIAFMINQRFPTWHVYILRFITPLGIFLAIIGGFFMSNLKHLTSVGFVDVLSVIFIVIPWLCIPGFAIYQMTRSVGTIKDRFLRCCRPTDWFPVEAVERQKYEEALGNVDITHTFSELKNAEIL